MSKEMWIDEYDRIREELLNDGIAEDIAEEIACKMASGAVAERFADMIDNARMRQKEGR